MPLKQDFGSFRQPVDVISPLQQAISNVQSVFANMENQESKQKQFDEELLLQKAAEERAKQAADLRMKEYNRAIEQDNALKKALLEVSGDTATSKVLPATTSTKDVAGTFTEGEVQGIDQGRKNLEDILLNLQKEQTTNPAVEISKTKVPTGSRRIAAENRGEVFREEGPTLTRRGVGLEDPYMQPVYDDIGQKTNEVSDLLSSMFTDHEVPTTANVITPSNKETPSVDTVLPLTDRIAQAQKDLDLYNQQATQAGTDIAKDRTTTTTVTTPEKVEVGKMNREEWETREKEKLKGLNLSGKGLSDALTVIGKKSDQLFGSSTPLKLSDQLKLLKYQQERKDKQLTMSDYETLYPSQKGKIKTPEGFKAYEKTLGDSASKKFNLAETLYKNMTSKDSGDADAIYKFLSDPENNKRLGNMSSDELRTIAAQLQAKYNNESYYDPSDIFFGGSTFGDASSGIFSGK